MRKSEDVIAYDVYELDMYELKKKVLKLGIKELIVYGIGNNGYYTYTLFKNMGIKIKYFVDVKAIDKVCKYKDHEVITPKKLRERYNGEYVVITPSIYESILRLMKRCDIPEDKIIKAFYKTETINIDYGNRFWKKISEDIKYSKEKPGSTKATFVTIAYNTPENLLRRAIESVLRQTVTELKYLFIVNGPTDNTLEVINEYAEIDKRIEVVDLDSNLPWTDPKLLSAIRDHIEGKYCCQLDSDDYYADDFLQETLAIGERNNADIICARTCLFSADSTFDPLNVGLEYDWHDKYYFNLVHPHCHVMGHSEIMTYYAQSEICSTFWGKLYSNSLMKEYLDYLIGLQNKERELYYRLDIAMTYRILSIAQRVFFTDRVLHFSQYSKKNSTFTLAPIEWMMSLWYSYKGIKEEMYSYYEDKRAHKYSKRFLRIHIMWMVGRKGMLNNDADWKYREDIINHMREMIDDPIFKEVLFNKDNYMINDCIEFYEKIKTLALQGAV